LKLRVKVSSGQVKRDATPHGRSALSLSPTPRSHAPVVRCLQLGGLRCRGKTGLVGLSGADARLVVAVSCVTRQVSGRCVRALGMICPRVRGGAGLAPAAGLIRSSSASVA
jgi:hypothetical protein